MQRDLWKRFNQLLVVPIVGVGVLYVALEPSTPAVDTEVASAVQDASLDIGVSANRDIDPTTVPKPDVSVDPSVAPGASTTASVPAASPPSVSGSAPTAPAAEVAATTSTSTAPSTTTAPSTSTAPPTTTSTTSTTVPTPPVAVTTTTAPTADPECLVQIPLPLGDGWLCVVPGAGALIG